MKTTLYLTRHGETKWNSEKRMQGRKNSPLTSTGILQAQLLQKRLKDVKFSKVYSSPSERAFTTAQIISGQSHIITDERIMEISVGMWEGRILDEVQLEYPKEHHCYWNTPHLFNVEGMETFYDVQSRTKEFIKQVVKENINAGGNILIVSHGVTLKAMMDIWEHNGVERFWAGDFFKQTALAIIDVNEDLSGHIITAYDTNHLI